MLTLSTLIDRDLSQGDNDDINLLYLIHDKFSRGFHKLQKNRLFHYARILFIYLSYIGLPYQYLKSTFITCDRKKLRT